MGIERFRLCVVIIVCIVDLFYLSKSENATLSSTNGYLYVKQSYELSMTCLFNNTRKRSILSRFIFDNNITYPVVIRYLHKICDVTPPYTYRCNSTLNSSTLSVPPDKYYNGQTWMCNGEVDYYKYSASNTATVVVIVPVTTVNITSTGTGNYSVVVVEEGGSQNFTCTTGTSRPAAWIEWYIGGVNVTNQAIHLKQTDNDMFISYSRLEYTVKNSDHNKSVHCEAANIEEARLRSSQKYIYVQVPVRNVTITYTGNNNVADVVEGENQTFTCTTGTSRPAAWIEWYIGGRNVTNQTISHQPQQVGDTFISYSSLVYKGYDTDHNKKIWCRAVNIEGRSSVNSTDISIYIQVPVRNVTITYTGNNNVVEGENKTFTCNTSTSRPAAWIDWYIGGQHVANHANPNSFIYLTRQQVNDKFISFSSLIYMGNDIDHNKTICCRASNIKWRPTVNSKEILLYIKVIPRNINLEPPTRNYTIRETERITRITCTAKCRPECKFYWSGPNNYMQIQSNLEIESIYRNGSGTYTCNGTSELGSKISGVEIEVYYPPSIKDLITLNNTIVAEGETAFFQCNIDSNPKSNIEWKFLETGDVVQKDIGVLQSNFIINRTECSHTGRFECKASNKINNVQEISQKTTQFSVLCSARLDNSQLSTPSIIGIKLEESLNITVHLIAVPRPTISWDFYSTVTGKYSSLNSTDVYGNFAHVSNLQKLKMSQIDFGVYTMTAYNQVGLEYRKSFTVTTQRPPDPPRNILLVCATISMTVLWISEFNGGDTQTFKIIWWKGIRQEDQYISNLSDPGYGKYVYYTVNNLHPNTHYFATAETMNTYGRARSVEIANCSTTERLTIANAETVLLTAGMSTLTVGLVAAVLSAVLLYMSRCHRKQGKQKRSENYIDLNTGNNGTTNSYSTLEHTAEYEITGDNGAIVKRSSNTYEEYQANSDRSAEHNYNSVCVLQSGLKTKDHVYANVRV